MPTRTSPLFTSILVVAAGIAIAMNLHHPPVAPVFEELPPLPAETETPAPPADLRAPQASEVVQTVYRAFPAALPADAVQAARALVGDFNGDGSPDLAVPARALGARLAQINGDWRNWILQDPHAAALPADPRTLVPRTFAREDETLLAVVHGVGRSGWRSPEARQAYLLTDVSATPLTVLPPARARTIAAKPVPIGRLRGDLLYDASTRRFLYWTGARYAWHPS